MTNAELFSGFERFLQRSADEHELGAPAPADELAFVPRELHSLYRMSNGAALFDGDLLFFAAAGASDEDGTVQHASRLARAADWPIPKELVLFGRDTGGEVLGVWTGERDRALYPSPIVLTGMLFVPEAHALLATSVERYLLTTVVWHCLGTEYADTAFQCFRVPKEFQVEDLDALNGEAWFAWSDPDLPAVPADPYAEPLTGEQIHRLLQQGPAAH